jgi:hypothetical protein
MEVGIDRPGLDYRNFELTQYSPLQCQAACQADSACRAFTYVNPGIQGANAHCWLKSALQGPWNYCSYCTSGTLLGQEASTDRGGSDYNNFDLPEARPELCEAACARDYLNCRAYSYVVPGAQGPNARCWLKNGVPSPSANSAVVSGVNRGLEVGIDRPGKDYSNFSLSAANPELCRDSCSRDSKCKAFTYVAPGIQEANAHCWLKSAVPAPSTTSSGIISGVKRGLEINTDRGGSDYNNFDLDVAVPEVCQASCSSDAQCVAFTYVPPGRQTTKAHCWLKNAIPAASSNEGMVSGIKGVEFF